VRFYEKAALHSPSGRSNLRQGLGVRPKSRSPLEEPKGHDGVEGKQELSSRAEMVTSGVSQKTWAEMTPPYPLKAALVCGASHQRITSHRRDAHYCSSYLTDFVSPNDFPDEAVALSGQAPPCYVLYTNFAPGIRLIGPFRPRECSKSSPTKAQQPTLQAPL
jgi:hypothetical protein